MRCCHYLFLGVEALEIRCALPDLSQLGQFEKNEKFSQRPDDNNFFYLSLMNYSCFNVNGAATQSEWGQGEVRSCWWAPWWTKICCCRRWCQTQEIFSCFSLYFAFFQHEMRTESKKDSRQKQKETPFHLTESKPPPSLGVSVIVPHCLLIIPWKRPKHISSLFVVCKASLRRARHLFFDSLGLQGLSKNTQLRIPCFFAFCFSALMTVKFTSRAWKEEGSDEEGERKSGERSEKFFLCFSPILRLDFSTTETIQNHQLRNTMVPSRTWRKNAKPHLFGHERQ